MGPRKTAGTLASFTMQPDPSFPPQGLRSCCPAFLHHVAPSVLPAFQTSSLRITAPARLRVFHPQANLLPRPQGQWPRPSEEVSPPQRLQGHVQVGIHAQPCIFHSRHSRGEHGANTGLRPVSDDPELGDENWPNFLLIWHSLTSGLPHRSDCGHGAWLEGGGEAEQRPIRAYRRRSMSLSPGTSVSSTREESKAITTRRNSEAYYKRHRDKVLARRRARKEMKSSEGRDLAGAASNVPCCEHAGEEGVVAGGGEGGGGGGIVGGERLLGRQGYVDCGECRCYHHVSQPCGTHLRIQKRTASPPGGKQGFSSCSACGVYHHAKQVMSPSPLPSLPPAGHLERWLTRATCWSMSRCAARELHRQPCPCPRRRLLPFPSSNQ